MQDKSVLVPSFRVSEIADQDVAEAALDGAVMADHRDGGEPPSRARIASEKPPQPCRARITRPKTGRFDRFRALFSSKCLKSLQALVNIMRIM